MKYTNKHNIPEPLASALKFESRPFNPKRLSVTTLIGSPRIAVLRERHGEESECDISENLWMFLGQMGHRVVEEAGRPEDLVEEKLTYQVGDYTVVGKVDLWVDGIVTDYKITSVWSYILGSSRDYEEQLNCYDFLFRHNGFESKGLQVVMICRDWQQSKAETDKDYPKCPVLVVPVRQWATDEQQHYIEQRMSILRASRLESDEELVPCTKDEMWERGEAWAVKKKGGKRAKRVFDNPEAAEKLLGELGDAFEIEHRPGDRIRCRRNGCGVAEFCNIFKEAKNG
jgi:hypothetical protein